MPRQAGIETLKSIKPTRTAPRLPNVKLVDDYADYREAIEGGLVT